MFHPKTLLDKTYEVGILLKGADGILEIIAAILLLAVSPATILNITDFLTHDELTENSHDYIATYVLHTGQHLANGGTTYGVIYLFAHGLIKVIVVAALLRNKMWAYPFSFVTLGLFVVYQMYQIIVDRSIGITLLTIFDLFIIYLVWREYKVQKALRQETSSS